jgi:hypothetical protein
VNRNCRGFSGVCARAWGSRRRSGAGSKFREAEEPARKCLFGWEEKRPDHWRTFYARTLLGGSFLGQKRYDQAENLLLTGFEGLKLREDRVPPVPKRCMEESMTQIVKLFEETERPDKAAEWRQKLANFTQAQNQKSSVNQSNGVVKKP